MKHFQPPPQKDIKGLIVFIMDHGLGRTVVPNKSPAPWTANALSLAMDDAGFTIGERTIDNWRAGSNPPNDTNLRILADFVSNNYEQRTQWLEALLNAARKPSPHESHPINRHLIAETDRVPTRENLPKANGGTAPPNIRERMPLFISMFGVIALCVALLAWNYETMLGPKVSNLKVCDEQHFSIETKKCSQNMTKFPRSTEKLFTSFELNGVKDGQQFERIWFRCGRKIGARTSRYTPPWEGWTWFKSDELREAGPFALNVVVGDEVASLTFLIGEADTADCSEV